MEPFNTNDSIHILILTTILLACTLFCVVFEIAIFRPFREERRYFKLEISRSEGEERKFWERELKYFYIRTIPIIGKMLWKRRRKRK